MVASSELGAMVAAIAEEVNPRVGYQAACNGNACGYLGSTVFTSPDAPNQAYLQGRSEHSLPGHPIIVQSVSLA